MSHYDNDELLRYADDPSTFDDSETLETHISGCQDCSYRLDIVTGLEERLRDQATWKLVEEVEQPVTPSSALLEYADRLERACRSAAVAFLRHRLPGDLCACGNRP